MIYLTSLPNHKKHQNINGNSLMSEKIYSRYFKLNETLCDKKNGFNTLFTYCRYFNSVYSCFSASCPGKIEHHARSWVI